MTSRTNHRTRLLPLVILTLSLLGTALPAHAVPGARTDTADTATLAGSESVTGGALLACPKGMAVVGFHGIAGTYLNALQPVCKTLIKPGADVVPTEPPTTLDLFGLPGVSNVSAVCPTGEVVVGLHGGVGAIIDGMGPQCQPFVGNAVSGGIGNVTKIGGNGGAPASDTCSSGFATAVDLDTAAFDSTTVFQRIELRCETIATIGDYQPDLAMNGLGDNVHNTDAAGQRKTLKVRPGRTGSFLVESWNDGTADDLIAVRGPQSKQQCAISYWVGTNNLTSEFTDSDGRSYETPVNGAALFKAKIKPSKNKKPKSSCEFILTASSDGAETAVDTFALRVIVKG